MKKHLIFSEFDDISSNHLIDWLLYFNQKYVRYNGLREKYKQYPQLIRFFEDNISISINSSQKLYSSRTRYINASQNTIQSVYFRRPYNKETDCYTAITHCNRVLPDDKVNKKLQDAALVLKETIVDSIKFNSNKILGTYHRNRMMKPVVLHLAALSDFNIPNTLISNKKSDILNFFYDNNKKMRVLTKDRNIFVSLQKKPL
jgi:hypothetical protein